MAGLTVSLDTAEQTLLNTQLEIQTSSNNISNANNTWYSRETAVQTDNPPMWTPSGWLGTGASVTQITQARDQYLDGQVLDATSEYSQYSNLETQLQTIQSAASDSGDTGISQALGAFFDSWDTLSQNTSDLSSQSSVYQAAQNLASSIQSTYNQLDQIAANSLPGQVQDAVDQANSYISQIAQLNTEIVQSSANGAQPNTLIDQRYEAMDNLAQLIPVSFSTDSSGTVTVTTNTSGGQMTIVSGGTGTDISTSSAITGGELGGLLQAQTDLTGYMNNLDTFASTLISQVNNLPEPDGGPEIFTGTDASNITASTTFLSGQSSADLASRALAIANLQDAQVDFSDGTTGTLQNYLSNIQEQIGNDTQQATNNSSFYQSLQTELQNQQQSVSGVSLDEEMVNVIQEQQVYQAAAKVVETVSGLMSTVISMVQPATG